MKLQRLFRSQVLNTPLDQAWDFFSTPKNLNEITPKDMQFDIITKLGDEHAYPGMIIEYKVRPLLNIPMSWVTEITAVKAKEYFIDEQRFGPYKFWHHKHTFEALDDKVKMTDEVHYLLPFGIFGSIGLPFIRKKLEDIFDYRYDTLDSYFNK